MSIKFEDIPTFKSDDEYFEYLDSIDDSNAVFHCVYWVVRYAYIPEIAPAGTEIYYIEAGKKILRKYEAMYAFYDKHGLSKAPLCNAAGEIIKDPVYESDLTEEGMRFVEIANHWRDTKGAAKNPPDTKYLERKLKVMREQA
ncbi:hypothetical protein [Neisseria elongata]|uniref:hypothetical protein n=1 Tax=Neisseria elongata TaxID=495 RepID=UPI000665B678|nr:hypothetical protein [Neisseria elongata]